MIAQITETIFKCDSLECLREIEDFVLENQEHYAKPEIKCIYAMLEVKNKLLYEERLVDKLIYKDT